MPDPKIAPHGAWESPVAAAMLTQGALRFMEIAADGGDVFWIESRPEEAGRYAAMRLAADGALNEVTDPEHSARTLVHEYGGGAFIAADGAAFYANFKDQRLCSRPTDASADARPITPEGPFRYADATVDRQRERLICVLEDHSGDGEAENCIATVPTAGGEHEPLHRGFDFYAAPPRFARRTPPRLDLLEPPAHALGRHRTLARRHRLRRRVAQRPPHRRRRPRR